MKNKKALFTTKWITYTAMLTAFVVATNFIPPVATPAGRIYWVDGVVLISAYLMDPLSAFISGGVGSFLYDVFQSPSMMLPSLLIHGLQGAIVSAFLHYVLPKKPEPLWAAVSSLIGAVEVVLGYFAYRVLTQGAPLAVASIPRNIIQEIIGISIAMVLCYATTFKKQLAKNHLLPDFKGEVLCKNKNREETPSDATTENGETAAENGETATENR